MSTTATSNTGEPEVEVIQPLPASETTFKSETPPIDTGYNAPPSYSSNKEWEEDRRSLSKAQHDALNGFSTRKHYH